MLGAIGLGPAGGVGRAVKGLICISSVCPERDITTRNVERFAFPVYFTPEKVNGLASVSEEQYEALGVGGMGLATQEAGQDLATATGGALHWAPDGPGWGGGKRCYGSGSSSHPEGPGKSVG